MRSVAWWRGPEDLDDDQKAVINLHFNKDWILLGPPGSGKSNILVLRGSMLAKSGRPNFLLLSFTRVLSEFMLAGAESRYALPGKAFGVFFSWSTQLLRQHGVDAEDLYPSDATFDTKRSVRLEKLQELIAAGTIPKNLYSAVLVDEVQDFWKGEIEVLRNVGRHLFVVGDARQRIYTRNEGIDAAIAGGCEEKRLKWHYRIGRKICETADLILPPSGADSLLGTSQYREADNPSRRLLVPCGSEQEQTKELLSRLRDQLRVFRGEYLGVICPTRRLRDRIWDEIEQSDLEDRAMLQSFDAGYEAFDVERPICVMTAHAAKGLEFRAVHLPFAQSLANWPRQVSFTAVTRAKTSLTAYATATVPGWFEEAFTDAPTSLPKLDDLWIKK